MLSGGPLSSAPLSDDAGQLDAGTGWFSRDYFGVSAGYFATDYFMGDGDGDVLIPVLGGGLLRIRRRSSVRRLLGFLRGA